MNFEAGVRLANSLVITFKRDYAKLVESPDSLTAMAQLPKCFR
jgi:hypothetical protein